MWAIRQVSKEELAELYPQKQESKPGRVQMHDPFACADCKRATGEYRVHMAYEVCPNRMVR